MIFKVQYQETKVRNPKREDTKALYMEAESAVEARRILEKNTPYNVEFVQVIDGKHLAYEQQKEDFQIVEF